MMEEHPISQQIPRMSLAEFEDLKASIKANGLRHPVVTLEGMILDGRHRYRACRELGLAVKTEPFTGEDPDAFVLDENVFRRHLNEAQRAMIAANRANMNGPGQPKKNSANLHNTSLADAAEKLRVGRRSVATARKVQKDAAPEVVRAVEAGELSLNAAKSISALPKRDQQEIALTEDPKTRREKIKTAQAKASAKVSKPPEFVLNGGRAVDPSDAFYTVKQWEELSLDERKDAIAAGFESKKTKLNEQTTDSIEWARWSHNTVTGCLHNCPYCYARDIAERFYPQKFEPVFHPSRLSAPERSKIPPQAQKDESYRNIFANSMSDLFGSWVPFEWIEATIEMAKRNPDWNFLTLTKFPQRASDFEFPENWWMGTTVDAQARVSIAERAFEKIKCGTKWLSVEPLLEPLRFERLDLFNWIVIGGASSSSKTPAWVPPLDWVVNLHLQAREARLKIYYKTNCGMQDELRIREFPWVKSKPKVLPKSFRYTHGLRQSENANIMPD